MPGAVRQARALRTGWKTQQPAPLRGGPSAVPPSFRPHRPAVADPVSDARLRDLGRTRRPSATGTPPARGRSWGWSSADPAGGALSRWPRLSRSLDATSAVHPAYSSPSSLPWSHGSDPNPSRQPRVGVRPWTRTRAGRRLTTPPASGPPARPVRPRSPARRSLNARGRWGAASPTHSSSSATARASRVRASTVGLPTSRRTVSLRARVYPRQSSTTRSTPAAANAAHASSTPSRPAYGE